MTDDEHIAQIERICRRMHDCLAGTMPIDLMTVPVADIALMLRVIRDQRAELLQARQAIAYMRHHFEAMSEKHQQNLVAIEVAAAIVQERLK